MQHLHVTTPQQALQKSIGLVHKELNHLAMQVLIADLKHELTGNSRAIRAD